eukprot:g5563.t1
MSSYQIYKPLHPPTGVEHAVCAHFTSTARWNIVLARTSLLEVYDVVDGANGKALDLVAQYTLHGNIESLHVLHFPGTVLDCLMLSFREAKLSVVRFDATVARLQTLFIHDFEPGSPGAGAKAKAGICDRVNGLMDVPIVRVEPQSQCAVMMLCDTHLAVVPFRRDRAAASAAGRIAIKSRRNLGPLGGAGAVAAAGGAGAGAPGRGIAPAAAATLNLGVAHAPFVVSLEDLGLRGFVKDVVFLHGFYDPTLLFLHEIERTASGRLSRRANTCAVTCICVRPADRTHTKIWACEGLPADSSYLRAVPSAVGGAVVLSTNALVYVSNNSRCALAMNDYARVTLDCDAIGARRFTLPPSIAPLALDAARCGFVEDDRLLLSTRTGLLLLASLNTGGSHQVRELSLAKLGSSVLCSCICPVPELRLFLLGSRLADSQLIQFDRRDLAAEAAAKAAAKMAAGGTGGASDADGVRPAKRQKVDAAGAEAGGSDDDDVEAALYGSAAPSGAQMQHLRDQQASPEKVAAAAAAAAAAPGAVTAAPAADGLDDDEDVDLYGDSAAADDAAAGPAAALSASAPLKLAEGESPYKLRPCFSLFNMGPIRDMAVGECPPDEEADEEDDVKAETDAVRPPKRVELVACCGQGKNAAVTVLQRGVRFELISEVELSGCSGMWAVQNRASGESASGAGDAAETDAFIIISTRDSASGSMHTRVLATGEGLEEVDEEWGENDLVMDKPTLAAGNLGRGSRIVQVSAVGIRLLCGRLRVVQEALREDALDVGGLQVPLSVRIVAVDVCDPYVLMRLGDGTLRLASYGEGRDEEEAQRLQVSVPDVPIEGGAAIAACLFHDGAGMLGDLWRQGQQAVGDQAAAAASLADEDAAAVASTAAEAVSAEMEDDDDDLYGGSSTASAAPSKDAQSAETTEQAAGSSAASSSSAVGRTYCVLCRESGVMEIYSVPDFTKCFSAPRLATGPAVLQSTLHGSRVAPVAAPAQGGGPAVLEVALHQVGPVDKPELQRCVLAVFCDTGELYVYQLRAQGGSASTGRGAGAVAASG